MAIPTNYFTHGDFWRALADLALAKLIVGWSDTLEDIEEVTPPENLYKIIFLI